MGANTRFRHELEDMVTIERVRRDELADRVRHAQTDLERTERHWELARAREDSARSEHARLVRVGGRMIAGREESTRRELVAARIGALAASRMDLARAVRVAGAARAAARMRLDSLTIELTLQEDRIRSLDETIARARAMNRTLENDAVESEEIEEAARKRGSEGMP